MKKLLIILTLFPALLMGQNVGLKYAVNGKAKLIRFANKLVSQDISYNVPNLYIGDSVITGTNANMNGANEYEEGIGGLNPDMTTTPGVMTLDLSALGNKAVKLDNGDLIGVGAARMYMRARRISGPEMSLHVGRRFATTVDNESDFEVTPDTTWGEYIVTMRGTSSDVFWIGSPNAFNQGSTFEIDYCYVFEVDAIVEQNEQSVFAEIPKVNNGGNWLTLLNSSEKKLNIVGIVANSLLANNYGGESNREPFAEEPPRGTVRNVPRRLYDTLYSVTTGFNKPSFRRIDHPTDWTLTGTWIDTTGKDILLPAYGTSVNDFRTNYSYTSTSGATAEIVIPDGYENCAIIYHSAKNFYGADYADGVAVGLNGGSIAAYGDTVINTYRNTAFSYSDDLYAISEYNDLPAGANTITITKDSSTDNLVMWGVAYWTGKTIIVLNYARGGNSNFTLWATGIRENQRLNEDLYYRNFDFVIYEMPGMNHAGDSDALAFQQAYYENILNTFKTIPSVLVTSHAFGCSDGSCTTNYYTLYNTPVDLERRYNRSYNYSYYDGYETYNIFRDFKPLYEVYGTLESGEGAKIYTTDGQHQNTLCTEEWMRFLMENVFK